MKFPKYCKWCLICLIPVVIFGIPLFIRDGLSWTTFIAFGPLLLCPIIMGIVMGQMCEDKSCKKEEIKNCESKMTDAIEK